MCRIGSYAPKASCGRQIKVKKIELNSRTPMEDVDIVSSRNRPTAVGSSVSIEGKQINIPLKLCGCKTQKQSVQGNTTNTTSLLPVLTIILVSYSNSGQEGRSR
ncbi:unnamed protein product [Cyprideis torosa]|uniref:Uncharacterized protein n=1 Tax=Cyprideis torosa TaxID=163714 RepID=A0A7R8ZP24_9CRUS|nr:unnamed protein product [Cyprideis torosa]CAG0888884.1 unnamed protein product [Cyprideis torosa]